METNQVRYFLALCEEENFTRAAKRCGVSQPSVSNAIRRLEEEFGGDLFHRTKNGAKLSPLGVAIAHISIRLMSVQKVPDARWHIFQQPTWSQFQRAPSLRAKFFTVPRLRLVLFLLEYYSVTSTT